MRRSEAELVAASKHVLYEIQQVDQYASMLSTIETWIQALPDKSTHQTLRNALLEAFCIHVRIVLEFLGPRGRVHSEDIIAEDYFDADDAWTNVRPAWPTQLEDVRARVNTQLAHLSYRRLGVTDQAKSWRFLEIVDAMTPGILAFYQRAPRMRLHDDWGIAFAGLSVATFVR